MLTSVTNFASFLTILGVAPLFYTYARIKAMATTPKIQGDPIFDSKRKLVVISGCDRGFGLLLAKELAKDPTYIVVALTLTKEGAQALESVDGIFPLQCDVTSDDDVKRAGAFCVDTLLVKHDAVLFAIVNNAGIPAAGDFLFFEDISKFQKVMDVNFFGSLRLTQALLPAMLKTSRKLTLHPRIINMSSVCGVRSSPANSTYNASKFAVEAWSDSLRLELEPFNIQVSKIRPGQINTDIQKDWASTYLHSFKTAPKEIQTLYGGDTFSNMAQAVLSQMGAAGSCPPPSLVVDMLMQTMTISKLNAFYFVGKDAHTLWRAMAALPVSIADSLARAVRFPYPMEEKQSA